MADIVFKLSCKIFNCNLGVKSDFFAPVATAPECPVLSEPGSFRAELSKVLIEKERDHVTGEAWVSQSIGQDSHAPLSAATYAMSVAKHLLQSFIFLRVPFVLMPRNRFS